MQVTKEGDTLVISLPTENPKAYLPLIFEPEDDNLPMVVENVVAGEDETFFQLTEGLEKVTDNTPVPIEDGVLEVLLQKPDEVEALLNEVVIDTSETQSVTIILDNGETFSVSKYLKYLID